MFKRREKPVQMIGKRSLLELEKGSAREPAPLWLDIIGWILIAVVFSTTMILAWVYIDPLTSIVLSGFILFLSYMARKEDR